MTQAVFLCFERPVPGFVPSAESLKISMKYLNPSYKRAKAFKKDIQTNLSAHQMVDLVITMMQGITALHISNEPDLPPGCFASLIPAAMNLLEKAWSLS